MFRRGLGLNRYEHERKKAAKAAKAMEALMARNNFDESVELQNLRAEAAEKMEIVHDRMNTYNELLRKELNERKQLETYAQHFRYQRIILAAVASVFSRAGYLREMAAILDASYPQNKQEENFLASAAEKLERIADG